MTSDPPLGKSAEALSTRPGPADTGPDVDAHAVLGEVARRVLASPDALRRVKRRFVAGCAVLQVLAREVKQVVHLVGEVVLQTADDLELELQARGCSAPQTELA